MPRGTGTPNSRSIALAWYSWMFMEPTCRVIRKRDPAYAARVTAAGYGRLGYTYQDGRDLLAGLDQAFDRLRPISRTSSRSAPLSSISTMRSTPLAPITTGTPT